VHPNFRGVPWWGAIVIAVTATVIGFAFDAGSGNKELTSVFASLYLIGCVAAVLAVQRSGLFTAVVQPPLLLFVAVPGAYFLFHQSAIGGLRDVAINAGYPLIERFLLMLTTSALVLLIGAVRWYVGSRGASETADAEVESDTAAPGGLRAKISALINGTDPEDLDDGAEPAPAHGVERSAARKSTPRRSSTGRDPKRAAPTRSRHARPPIDDVDAEPPRRRRPVRDEDPAAPRRRPREPREPRQPGARSRDYRPRDREPRERDPRERATRERDPRDSYDRPRRRPNRYESYEPYPAEPSYEAPRRRPTTSGDSSHHPVSRVRYRGAPDDGDDRAEHRTRPRTGARHSLDSDRWRYDA